jgi:broad specificity phosphatase PhoE
LARGFHDNVDAIGCYYPILVPAITVLTPSDSYVSPRKRAQRTFELLNLGLKQKLPWEAHGPREEKGLECEAEVEITEDIREWDYGDYEGVTSPDIKKLRQEQGLGSAWDIWRDGCPGGE